MILHVGGKRVSFYLHSLGIEGNELVGHLVHRFADPLTGFLPLSAVETVKLNSGILPGADVLGHQIQLGDRNVKGVRPGVLDFDVVFDDAVKIQLVDSVKMPIP